MGRWFIVGAILGLGARVAAQGDFGSKLGVVSGINLNLVHCPACVAFKLPQNPLDALLCILDQPGDFGRLCNHIHQGGLNLSQIALDNQRWFGSLRSALLEACRPVRRRWLQPRAAFEALFAVHGNGAKSASAPGSTRI
jgi:hypothetical protein